jgi:hypothetical protein
LDWILLLHTNHKNGPLPSSGDQNFKDVVNLSLLSSLLYYDESSGVPSRDWNLNYHTGNRSLNIPRIPQSDIPQAGRQITPEPRPDAGAGLKVPKGYITLSRPPNH